MPESSNMMETLYVSTSPTLAGLKYTKCVEPADEVDNETILLSDVESVTDWLRV
jgi:hypothetical protein